jgi:hypothetical protein
MEQNEDYRRERERIRSKNAHVLGLLLVDLESKMMLNIKIWVMGKLQNLYFN